jgi:hypothetical protein
MFVPNWIHTYSGKRAYPLDFKVDQVDIIDIAHALGHQCRFSGHSQWFYSVAQHSYYVSIIVEQLGGTLMDQLCGLLHDASEAYLQDMATPIKVQVTGYREAEEKVMAVICEKFGLPLEFSPLVKRADMIALATEARDLMKNPDDWHLTEAPIDWNVDRWKVNDARSVFTMHYHYLMEQIEGGRYWVERMKKVSNRFDPRKKVKHADVLAMESARE